MMSCGKEDVEKQDMVGSGEGNGREKLVLEAAERR